MDRRYAAELKLLTAFVYILSHTWAGGCGEGKRPRSRNTRWVDVTQLLGMIGGY